MRNIVKRILGRGSEDQKGFTLIELLIVVGIIVALAAVIIPLVIQFAGKGEEGANAAEWDSLQTAVDAMMTDNLETASSTSTSATVGEVVATGNTFGMTAGTPGLDTIGDYMRDLPTKCMYTWTDNGSVTQDVVSTTDAGGAANACIPN